MQRLTKKEYGTVSTTRVYFTVLLVQYITEYTSFHISARGFDCTQTYADTFGILSKVSAL